jgi:hypothetical protein
MLIRIIMYIVMGRRSNLVALLDIGIVVVGNGRFG